MLFSQFLSNISENLFYRAHVYIVLLGECFPTDIRLLNWYEILQLMKKLAKGILHWTSSKLFSKILNKSFRALILQNIYIWLFSTKPQIFMLDHLFFQYKAVETVNKLLNWPKLSISLKSLFRCYIIKLCY